MKILTEWCKQSPFDVLYATENQEEWISIVQQAGRAANDPVEVVKYVLK